MNREIFMQNNRIAIVITGLSFGGAERVTSFLCNYFAQRGREVYLISLTTGEHAYPLLNKVIIRELSSEHTKNKLAKYRYLIHSIRKEIKTIQPSIVLGMMSYSGSLAAIACYKLGIPFIISERNDPNTSETFSKFEKRIFSYVHHHMITKAIFQTESARSYYFKEQDPRGVIIPNPLYLEDMPAPKRELSKTNTIVTAGRLSYQKNHALLIRAFKLVHQRHPEYSLKIFGEGEERKNLEELAQELGIGTAVYFPGITKDMFCALQEAEIFVLSSNYEGMPNALIEAMAMGLPCVTTDYSEGRGTVIRNGIDGLVVPRNNPEALSQAILRLIENDSIALVLGREASKIREDLDSNLICQRWLAVIQDTEMHYYRRKEN
jgi:glycosyltransferase involved in cell wall biosynthesis